jgi:Asp-tRNA(Asn)/Glu-tRNA(Gln) amidotransferase A subunit family amidase
MAAEVARSFRQLMPRRGSELSASLREFIARGEAASTEDLAAARALVARVAQRLYPAAERGALLISPATLDTAPVGLHATGSALLNRPWSVLGLAVMTVPAGRASDGLPVGLQLIDPHPAGDRLFGSAAFIESVLFHPQ